MTTRKVLIFRYLAVFATLVTGLLKSGAAEPPAYAAYFSSKAGFYPAQPNFQKIFLQMAGSLEHFASPEPYLRHVMAENDRIAAKYKAATGKELSCRPSYFTDEYLEKLLANWKRMEPVLALDSLCKESGRNMRYAIMGSWNMSVGELVAAESKLTPEESAAYRRLLEKVSFSRADFPAMEAFYKTAFGKLSEGGKDQISKRTMWGTLSPEKRKGEIENDKGGTALLKLLNEHQARDLAHLENKNAPKANADTLEATLIERFKLRDDAVVLTVQETPEHDAIFYSREIRSGFKKRMDQVRVQSKKPGQADAIDSALKTMVDELGMAAQMEFELGLAEGWAERKGHGN